MPSVSTSFTGLVADGALPPLLSARGAAVVLGCAPATARSRCAHAGVEPIELSPRHHAYVAGQVDDVVAGRVPQRVVVPEVCTPAGASTRLGWDSNRVVAAVRAGAVPGRAVVSAAGGAAPAVVAIRVRVVEALAALAAADGVEPVRAAFDDLPGELWPGLIATARHVVDDPGLPELVSPGAAAAVLGLSRTDHHYLQRTPLRGVTQLVLDERRQAVPASQVRDVAAGRDPAPVQVPEAITPWAAAQRLGWESDRVALAVRTGRLPGRAVTAGSERTAAAPAAVAIRLRVLDALAALAAADEVEPVRAAFDDLPEEFWPGLIATARH